MVKHETQYVDEKNWFEVTGKWPFEAVGLVMNAEVRECMRYATTQSFPLTLQFTDGSNVTHRISLEKETDEYTIIFKLGMTEVHFFGDEKLTSAVNATSKFAMCTFSYEGESWIPPQSHGIRLVITGYVAEGASMRNTWPSISHCFDAVRPQAGGVDRSKVGKVVAVVPARGGSVSIPLKNIKDLNGRPLLDWCVRAALDSKIFDEVWVSTDHDGIEEVSKKCGALVHRRDPSTATSTASTESALVEFVKAHPDYDVLCLIQATSPLVMPNHFTEALDLFCSIGADSLVTAVRAHRFLWKVDPVGGHAYAKNYIPQHRPRRQDWDGELIENGAFYFTSKQLMEQTQCRLGGKTACYEMPEHTMTELDSMIDWEIMTGLVKEYGYTPK